MFVASLAVGPLQSLTALGTWPDLLRLLVVPFFGYLAWRDVKTRRVPNKLWLPVAALGIFLLLWELYTVSTGGDPIARQRFYVQVAVSIGFLVPLSYFFWRIGGFGGADAKAFFVIALLFPTFPSYQVWQFGLDGLLDGLPGVVQSGTLPAVEPTLGVFSITILSNTVLLGALYPVALALRNALTLNLSPGMFFAKPIPWHRATAEYGTLFSFSDRRLRDSLSLSGLKAYSSWRGLDLDALRMYLAWRGLTLTDLQENPERYRDPASLPEEPNPPGDGAITAGGDPTEHNRATGSPASGPGPAGPAASQSPEPGEGTDGRNIAEIDDATVGEDSPRRADEGDGQTQEGHADPWGAAAFLEDIEGSAYGTTPETLRSGLDTLTSEETVWISPGIPFLVPLFVGLVLALTYGDILFVIFEALGIAA